MKRLGLMMMAICFAFAQIGCSQSATKTTKTDNQNALYDMYKTKKVNFKGYDINVEILGEGDPIFFFAGGPGNSHDYMQGNFGMYYKKNTLVFIDHLGRGLSEDAKDVEEYSVQNDVEVTEAVRKALGFNKIGLVGHSYGTVAAQAYAVKHPENVSKMFLIAGFHSGEMWQNNCDNYNYNARMKFPKEFEKVDSLRKLGYVSSDPEFQKVYWNIPAKYIYYHNTALNQNVPTYKFRGMNLDVYYAIIGRDADFYVSGSMMDTDFRKDLGKLDIPTVITAGRYDGVSTPLYNLQYKDFMPKAKFVMFENSAHNPYLEEPEKFYTLFEEFFGCEK